MITIGSQIKSIRRKKKLTQKELANKAQLNYHTLNKIESGYISEPRKDTLLKIANGLGISMNELVPVNQEPVTLMGELLLPFSKLGKDRFDSLIKQLILIDKELKSHTAEERDGPNDEGIDFSIQTNSQTYRGFQLKYATQRVASRVLETDLNKIKASSEFSERNYECVIFCTSVTIGIQTKKKVEKHAKSIGIDIPIYFWDEKVLDGKCKLENHIRQQFFESNTDTLVTSIDELKDEIRKSHSKKDLHAEKFAQIASQQEHYIQQTIPVLELKSNPNEQLALAKQLIDKKEYNQAREILIKLKSSEPDTKVLIETYTLLGTSSFNESQGAGDGLKQAVDYLQIAYDLDRTSFKAAKILIIAHINTGKDENFIKARTIADHAYETDEDNLEALGFCLKLNFYLKDEVSLKKLLEKVDALDIKKIANCQELCSNYLDSLLAVKRAGQAKDVSDQIISDFGHAIHSDILFSNARATIILAEQNFSTLSEFDQIQFNEEGKQQINKAIGNLKQARELANIEGRNSFFITAVEYQLYLCLVAIDKVNDVEFENLKTDLQKRSETKPVFDHKQKKSVEYLESIKKGEYNVASTLFLNSINDFDYTFVIKQAWLFFEECAIEECLTILDKTKIKFKDESQQDIYFWTLLGSCHALLGNRDKVNSFHRISMDMFKNAKKEDYQKILSHFSSLQHRYADSQEVDRIYTTIRELEVVSGNKIIESKRFYDDDENQVVSSEIVKLIKTSQKAHEQVKKIYASKYIPIIFLQKALCRNMCEVMNYPQRSGDMDFSLKYNLISITLMEKIKANYLAAKEVVLDYTAVYNLSYLNLLEYLFEVNKTFYVHKKVLQQIQTDLLEQENVYLRKAWNIVRNNKNKIKVVASTDTPLDLTAYADFDSWFVSGLQYAKSKDALYLCDDSILFDLLHEKGIKASNSFHLLINLLEEHLIDKKQYSLALGKLAELFYILIPFDDEDLMQIALDDHMGHTLPQADSEPDYKLSRRFYHLINQSLKIGPNAAENFLVVSGRFFASYVKYNLALPEKLLYLNFFTQYFFDLYMKFLNEDESVSIERYIKYVQHLWQTILETIKKPNEINELKILATKVLSELKERAKGEESDYAARTAIYLEGYLEALMNLK